MEFFTFQFNDPAQCLEANLPYNVKTDAAAFKFCRIALPYSTILSGKKAVVAGINYIQCSFHSELICKSGWKQLWGRCYLLISKQEVTLKEGKEICGKMKANLVDIHRLDLIQRLDDSFGPQSSVWVRTSQKNLPIRKSFGNATIIAYGASVLYTVKYGSLIGVDEKTDRAQVICEYDPPENVAYHLARLKQFRVLGIVGKAINQRLIIKTHGRYGLRQSFDSEKNPYDKPYEHAVCKAIMKVFSRDGVRGAYSWFDFNNLRTEIVEELVDDLSIAYSAAHKSENDGLCFYRLDDKGNITSCTDLLKTDVSDSYVLMERAFALVPYNFHKDGLKTVNATQLVSFPNGLRSSMFCQSGFTCKQNFVNDEMNLRNVQN
ncbi:unnamed protein product [Caenorhabditis bovis]|uniref:Uncharacterized protein n=1 Tax=Caenorhabditis bovis TaxID=2654633 RepID=A0A8S1EU25_9PELO|nr:unnamed protein product [Caenorhabditis bovis]